MEEATMELILKRLGATIVKYLGQSVQGRGTWESSCSQTTIFFDIFQAQKIKPLRLGE